MRSFLQCMRFAWPYRYRLVTSFGCAVMAAVLWSLNLTAIFPVLSLLNKPDQSWTDQIDECVDKYQKDYDLASVNLGIHRADLQLLSQEPEGHERDRRERQLAGAIAQIEGRLH